ncbi:conserved oligomeric Golgi complex subunit 3-like [Zophobas morio]|uniref:conserved oligomeric Golgi complex subunit 3-like n=1 Tax=Zophobas morio TaxID=2755281 RepID=UPI003083B410
MQELYLKRQQQADYFEVFSDCETCYFRQRRALLFKVVNKKIASIEFKGPELIAPYARQCCSFTLRIYQQEVELYGLFFPAYTQLLFEYLEDLLENLYNQLRPKIIKLIVIETLAELCEVLSSEFLDLKKSLPFVSFNATIRQLIQDVQSRLIFRAQIFIIKDIVNFKPTPEDLDYPAKLTTGDRYDQWCKPLQKTLAFLATIYRCVDYVIFRGLASEAISACLSCLQNLSDLLAQKSELDACLFLLAHLLLLKEQLTPFDIGSTWQRESIAETEITDQEEPASYDLLQLFTRDGPLVPVPFSLPKEKVEQHFEVAYEAFLQFSVKYFTEFLRDSVEKNSLNKFSAEESLKSFRCPCLAELQAKNKLFCERLHLYLGEVKEEQELYAVVKKKVLDGYQIFCQNNLSNFDFSELYNSIPRILIYDKKIYD